MCDPKKDLTPASRSSSCSASLHAPNPSLSSVVATNAALREMMMSVITENQDKSRIGDGCFVAKSVSPVQRSLDLIDAALDIIGGDDGLDGYGSSQ